MQLFKIKPRDYAKQFLWMAGVEILPSLPAHFRTDSQCGACGFSSYCWMNTSASERACVRVRQSLGDLFLLHCADMNHVLARMAHKRTRNRSPLNNKPPTSGSKVLWDYWHHLTCAGTQVSWKLFRNVGHDFMENVGLYLSRLQQ